MTRKECEICGFKMKILAIQFRYLGDAAMLTAALKAIRTRLPDCELNLLVAEEAAPLFEHLPWLNRVWGFPRKRGRAQMRASWPMIRALRRERFDLSIDFCGNDRGAFLSLLTGARRRIGARPPLGFLGRRFCYHKSITLRQKFHQTLEAFRLLEDLGIAMPESAALEIRPDPALEKIASSLLSEDSILCHLSTSQPKKEWPAGHWARLHRLASEAGLRLVFSTGISPREQSILAELRRLVPELATLPPLPDLATFLAVLSRARLMVTVDTGPLHFAAGMGVPTIALYGPYSFRYWAPFGDRHQVLQGGPCSCSGHDDCCSSPTPCMATIQPEDLFRLMKNAIGL